MAKTPAQRTIEALAKKYVLTHPDGTVNASAFYRSTQIPQPTISRIAAGKIRNLAPTTRALLMKAFSLTNDELDVLSQPNAVVPIRDSDSGHRTQDRLVAKQTQLSPVVSNGTVDVDAELLAVVLSEVLTAAEGSGVSRHKLADIAAAIYADLQAEPGRAVSAAQIARLIRLAS